MLLHPRGDGNHPFDNIVIYIELQQLCMVDNPTQVPTTSIIITMKTRDALKACKHGGNTYDDVLQKLMSFHHDKTGSIIVE